MPTEATDKQIQLALPSPTKLFTPGVTLLIILQILGFTLTFHAPDFTSKYLMLHPHNLLTGSFWELFSFSFVEMCSWNLIFTLSVLLFMGSAIEREWRTTSFLLLWFVTVSACAILWTLICLICDGKAIGWGSLPGTFGTLAAFGLVFRRKRFFYFLWTVEAQVLSLLLIAVGLILAIPYPWSFVWVAGAGVAYIYIKARWKLTQKRFNAPKAQGKRPGPFVEID